MSARIRKGDLVAVVTGDDKGKRGRVLTVLPERNRVVIEGVNLVFKHLRKSQQNPQGGRVRREAAIHVSNVMPIDPTNGFCSFRQPTGAPAGTLQPISVSLAGEGFSSKPAIWPLRSNRKTPRPLASSNEAGCVATVMSAPVATCASMRASRSIR